MPVFERLVAFLATAAFCLAGICAESPSKEAMFARLNALSATGNADVKYNLGMLLTNGIGTPRDPQAAFRHFSEAAEAGHELAAYKVGCYLAGQFRGVVAVDEEAAFKFKLRAAEAGYDLAQLDVGKHFGRKGDADTAVLWWERASHQGNVEATAYLANYLTGSASPSRIKGYALLLLLRDQMPNSGPEFAARMAEVESRLAAGDKAEAGAIRASWLHAKSPLTVKAEAGIGALPALLASLEGR